MYKYEYIIRDQRVKTSPIYGFENKYIYVLCVVIILYTNIVPTHQ